MSKSDNIYEANYVIVATPQEANELALGQAIARYFWRLLLLVLALIIAGAFVFEYYNNQLKINHPAEYYRQNPLEARQNGYKASEADLAKEYGPKTEYNAQGWPCLSGRCAGGYADAAAYTQATGEQVHGQ